MIRGLQNTVEPTVAPESPKGGLLLPTVTILILGLFSASVYISYQIPASPMTLSLVWIALFCVGLTSVVTFVLWRQLQKDYVTPLAHLAQSLDNISTLNPEQPVWGQERDDMVGEAARAAEKARQQWVSAPDVVVQTTAGSVPLRFNGAMAPLFNQLQQDMQAAVGSITKAAGQLQAGVEANQAGVRGFAEQLHMTLQQLTHATLEGTSRLAMLHTDIEHSTERLRLVQEGAVGQLSRMLPELEQRSDGLNEIVRLTGQQTAITLQQLQQSSHLMRDAADYNKSVGDKFASEADELSQRLFAAVNLLRSSGKVLSETNEVARARMHEILTTMTQAESALNQTLDSTRSRITMTADMADMLADLSVRTENNASMMATAVDGLLQHNASLTKQVDVSGKRLDSMLANVDNLQEKFASAVTVVAERSEQIEHVLRHLHGQHQQLMMELARSGGDSASTLGRLATESEQLIARIEAQLALAGAIADTELRRLGDATAAAAESAQDASNQLTKATQMLLTGTSKVESAADGMAGHLQKLDKSLSSSLQSLVVRTDQLATSNETRLENMTGKVEEMTQKLNTLGQLTNTMAQVAAQLAQLIPQLGSAGDDSGTVRREMAIVVKDMLEWQRSINATLATLPQRLERELGTSFEQQMIALRGQMEATRQDMMAAVSEEQSLVVNKLSALEEVTGFVADSVTSDSPKAEAGKVAQALRGIVTALSQINSQLHDIDTRLPFDGAEMVQEPASGNADQALSAVTDIFSSLRDRGDNVINRLNEMATHLQSAADKNQR